MVHEPHWAQVVPLTPTMTHQQTNSNQGTQEHLDWRGCHIRYNVVYHSNKPCNTLIDTEHSATKRGQTRSHREPTVLTIYLML